MTRTLRRLDPQQVLPLRRGPLCQRTKELGIPWRTRVQVLVGLVTSVVLLAALVWAGSL